MECISDVMDAHTLLLKRPNLTRRAELFRAVRNYFDGLGFLEVETNVRIPAPIPEESIESIAAEGEFLRTSPEIAMKIMIAAGYGRIYQIGRCFRADEHGIKHRSEFTLLEYYAAGMDYLELADFTAGLIRTAAKEIFGRMKLIFKGETISLDSPPEILTVADAYRKYCGISMTDALHEDIFDELMVTKVEPHLGRGGLTVLTDYPAKRASLARLKDNDPSVAERWELYAGGMELANAYGELTDPAEHQVRFQDAGRIRAEMGMLPYPEPDDFFSALRHGMPSCSGAALGMDRLTMLFADASDIGDVRAE